MQSESLETRGASGRGQSPQNPKSEPEKWVEDYGDFLFRYAVVRVRDVSKAEDLVQETFLAALKSQQNFKGRSTEKSWLLGILKHKLGDHFRKTLREKTFTDLEFYAAEEEAQFGDGGAWLEQMGPKEWPEPGASLDNALFWNAFHHCVGKLPANAADAFWMRELDEMPSEQIRVKLKISEENLWVILHRARLALRRCLEINWFRKRPTGKNE